MTGKVGSICSVVMEGTLVQRCTTFLGQGPQHIIVSALEGRRQNYGWTFEIRV